MHNSEANARQVRTAHRDLTARFEQARALDWPLTARDAQVLLGLVRRSLTAAEGYLEDAEAAAAMQSVRVGDAACGTLEALYALETMEV